MGNLKHKEECLDQLGVIIENLKAHPKEFLFDYIPNEWYQDSSLVEIRDMKENFLKAILELKNLDHNESMSNMEVDDIYITLNDGNDNMIHCYPAGTRIEHMVFSKQETIHYVKNFMGLGFDFYLIYT